MRTIKFRAWNLVRKEMWTDFFVDTDGNICYEVLHDEDDFKTMFWPPKDKNILMQSTGLFDKNGVEIWEGDVVRGQFQYGDDFGQATGEIEEIIKVVRWDEGMQKWPGFQVGEINFGEFPVEVLGNCFENPHLLEQK